MTEFTRRSVGAAIAAWIGFLVGPNALLASTQGLFMQPLSATFGLSRTAISAIMLIPPMTVALCSPFAGRAIDRWGARRILLPGVALFGVMHVVMGRVGSAGQLVLASLLLGLAATLHGSVGYAKVVAQWFHVHRGFVLGGVAALGTGLSSAIVPQGLRLLIRDHTWRGGYLGLAALILAVGLPSIAVLLHEPDHAGASVPAESARADLPGLTAREALRQRTFWLLAAAVLLASTALLGTLMHAFPMLTDRGFSPQTAATAVSCIFIGSVAGQLFSGYVVDRIDSPRAALPFFLAALVGVLVMHSAAHDFEALAGSVLLGVGTGAENGLAAYLISRYFGLRAFGNLFGCMLAAACLGLGIGLMAMAIAHDRAGDYAPMRAVFAVVMALAVLCVGLLGPYVYPRRFESGGLPAVLKTRS